MAWEVLCLGGTGGPAAPPGGSPSCRMRGGEGRCLRGPSGEGVCGGPPQNGDDGKKVWLSSLLRPWGGGCRLRGELEKTSGVFTGSRGGRLGGLSGSSDSE